MNRESFCPDIWQGEPKDFTRHDVYPWVKNLPTHKNIFCCFWAGWFTNFSLPLGYDYYIISYENENINIEWLKKQQEHTQGCFVVLHSGYGYNFKLPNTEFITYTRLHKHLNKMIQWWGIKPINPSKTYKFSTISNRLTQSKIWITTQLLETARNDSFLILNQSWLELKNVHNWQSTGNKKLDLLTDTFRAKYQSLEITDSFDQKDNHQRKNSNPYQSAYTECAIHFTNESFHYSGMFENDQEYVWPGPFVTEKTLKCLLGGTAFVPCGQFETYKFLQELGLQFQYGFDLSWDADPGNITRFEKICCLIQDLSSYGAQELFDKTFESTQFNRNFILDQKFHKNCEKLNQQSVEQLIKVVS